jgi:hypothetical protein
LHSDINECISGTSSCPTHQRCLNVPGSYACSDRSDTSTRSTVVEVGQYTFSSSSSSASRSRPCPSGTVWSVDLRRCEVLPLAPAEYRLLPSTPLRPVVSVLTGGSCPDGGVWNTEARQCDLPLAVTAAMSPDEFGGSDGQSDAGCPAGSRFNSRTGRCDGQLAVADDISTSTTSQQQQLNAASRCPIGYAWNRMSRRCEGIKHVWQIDYLWR